MASKTPECFRLVSSKTHELDRAGALRLAEKHVSLQRSPTERDLDPRHVQELVSRINAGWMIPFAWAVVEYNGRTYRMNGQHSSQALIEVGDSLPGKVVVHMDTYAVEEARGMAELFRQFDSRISSRSRSDVAGAYQGLIPGLAELSRKRVKLGIEGAAWYLRAIEKMPVATGDDLYEMLFEKVHHPFLAWLDKTLTIKTPELERAPIVGAMYGIYLMSQAGAEEFWSHAAKNDLNDDTDPRSVLSAELVAIKEEKRAVVPIEFYSKCVKAWNAFCAGDRIRSLNVNTKKGVPEIAPYPLVRGGRPGEPGTARPTSSSGNAKAVAT